MRLRTVQIIRFWTLLSLRRGKTVSHRAFIFCVLVKNYLLSVFLVTPSKKNKHKFELQVLEFQKSVTKIGVYSKTVTCWPFKLVYIHCKCHFTPSHKKSQLSDIRFFLCSDWAALETKYFRSLKSHAMNNFFPFWIFSFSFCAYLIVSICMNQGIPNLVYSDNNFRVYEGFCFIKMAKFKEITAKTRMRRF